MTWKIVCDFWQGLSPSRPVGHFFPPRLPRAGPRGLLRAPRGSSLCVPPASARDHLAVCRIATCRLAEPTLYSPLKMRETLREGVRYGSGLEDPLRGGSGRPHPLVTNELPKSLGSCGAALHSLPAHSLPGKKRFCRAAKWGWERRQTSPDGVLLGLGLCLPGLALSCS